MFGTRMGLIIYTDIKSGDIPSKLTEWGPLIGFITPHYKVKKLQVCLSVHQLTPLF